MNIKNRENKIIKVSITGMIVNVCIAIIKIILGFSVSSLAIISEGVNNATDAGSSFITFIGTKLSLRHPDEKHPFGYGKIEYLTSLTVAILILYASISMGINSIKHIMHPTSMNISSIAIIMIVVSAIIKLILSIHIIKEGKSIDSTVLITIGKECRNDSLLSIATLFSLLLYITTNISIDGWVGLLFSIAIFKNGYDTLSITLSELIGRPGDKLLAEQLYAEIQETDGILNVADMMLHNYGPNRWSGSVNIEIDHKSIIGDVYEYIHALQLRIMHEHNVTMVFGIYAVNNDDPASKEMRFDITNFVKQYDHLISYHALYKSIVTKTIYIDFVVDYELNDWEKLRTDFTNYMQKKYTDYEVELTIETQFV